MRRKWSRLVLFAMAAGLLVLFPGLRRSEIEFRFEIDEPHCVERLDLRIFEGDVLSRAHAQIVGGRRDLSYVAKLKHGEYRAIASVECRDGTRHIASRQPIVVDRDGVIPSKVSADECRCSER